MPLDLFFFFWLHPTHLPNFLFFLGRGGGRSFSNQAKIHFVRQDKEIMLVGAGAFLLTLMAVIFIQSAANSSGQEALSATVRGLAAMLVHTHWGGRRSKEKHEGVGELRGGGMLVDLEIGIVEIKRFSFSFMFLHFTCSHHTVNCQWKQAWSDLQLCFNLEHNLFNSADYWIYNKLTQHLPSRIYSPPLFNFVGLR